MQTNGQSSEEDEEFRKGYQEALNELTFNSKPKINTLTMIASENKNFSHVISSLIQDRILKLPALYLVDSICKNVREPYISLFAQSLDRIFKHVYATSDQKTRNSLKRVVETWKPIFPPSVITSIESFLSQSLRVSPASSAPSVSTHAFTAPPMSLPTLAAFTQQSQPPAPPPYPYAMQSNSIAPAYYQQQYGGNLLQAINGVMVQKQGMVGLDPQAASQIYALQQLSSFVQSNQVTPEQNTQILAHLNTMGQKTTAPPQISSSLSQLAALISDNRSTPATGATVQSSNKAHSDAVESLYDDIALQCKQCGFRFFDTVDGQAKMTAHLDWHFRQNKSSKEVKKIVSRDWFFDEDSWVSQSHNVDTTSAHAPSFFEGGENGPVKDNEPIPDSYIPAEEEITHCFICHEGFEKFWDDEEDCWMLRNAIKFDGNVYHDSCFRETSRIPRASDSVLGKRKAED